MTKIQYPDYFVFTNRSSMMQRIQDAVENGYLYFVQGTVKHEKAVCVLDKLIERYKTNQTPTQRLRAYEKGESLVQLFAYISPTEPEKGLDFYLLHRPAQGQKCPTISSEPWKTATNRQTRIESRGYELVRVPNERTHKSSKTPLKPYRWTWRYNAERLEQFEQKLKRCALRNSEEEYRSLFDTLKKTLGFSGSREQAKTMLIRLEMNWRRISSQEPPICFDGKLPTARRMKNIGVMLAELPNLIH